MKHLLLFFMMLLPLTASADAVEIDGLYYNLVNKSKTAEITRNPATDILSGSYSGDIIIPSKVTYESVEYNVTAIGENAFKNCFHLSSISIPNSVTNIGYRAFDGCSQLTSLIIPNSVTTIDSDAFFYCTSMTSITLSDNLTTIGEGAFAYCTSLKSIIIPNGVTKINNSTFTNCSNLHSVTIPNGVTIIDYNSFQNCTGLISINIPNSVTNIAINAFNNCSNLTTVIIGSGIQDIYNNSFANCAELTDVYCFAESVSSTGADTFNGSGVNYANLHVPASSVSSYSASAPWSGFGTIDAITSEDITIGDLGIGTFCGSNPLDLSGTEDVKAYVVSSYEKASGQVTLTRTYYIPPFTGVVVKGSKGTHTIPAGVGQPVFPNMMKGVTTNTALNKVNGDYTNYVLANKGGNFGFYAVTNNSTLAAGKAYLPLPTADLPTAAREFTLIFDDGETTEIMKVASQEEAPKGCYDLQGRRVANPTAGLYIVNGKKVIIK